MFVLVHTNIFLLLILRRGDEFPVRREGGGGGGWYTCFFWHRGICETISLHEPTLFVDKEERLLTLRHPLSSAKAAYFIHSWESYLRSSNCDCVQWCFSFCCNRDIILLVLTSSSSIGSCCFSISSELAATADSSAASISTCKQMKF